MSQVSISLTVSVIHIIRLNADYDDMNCLIVFSRQYDTNEYCWTINCDLGVSCAHFTSR